MNVNNGEDEDEISSTRYQSGQNPNAQPFDPSAFYISQINNQNDDFENSFNHLELDDIHNDNTLNHQHHHSNIFHPEQTSTEIANAAIVTDWYEVSCVRAGAPNLESDDSITSIAFDPIKELIWVGTASGMLHAHLSTDMSRVISSYISQPSSAPTGSKSSHVHDIVVSPSSVLAAVSYGLSIVSRGGVIESSVKADAVKDSKALALNPLTSGRHVCIGGESRMLSVIDTETSLIVRQATLRGPWPVTSATWSADENNSTANLAIFSTSTGRICICDPSTMREVNAIAAFTGAATCVTSNGYYLTATGLVSRSGVSYLEQNVKLFDIRQVDMPLPSVCFPSPPVCVTFDDWSAGVYGCDRALWGVAPTGMVQLMDVSKGGTIPLSDPIQLDAGMDLLTAMAVSSQGLLVLGDSGGFIHQWSCSNNVKVNLNSEPLWLPSSAASSSSSAIAANNNNNNDNDENNNEIEKLADDGGIIINTEIPRSSINLDELLTSDVGCTIPNGDVPEIDNGFLSDEMFDGNQRLHNHHHHHHHESYKDFYNREPFGRFPLVVSDDIVNRAQSGSNNDGSSHHQSSIAFTQAPPSFLRNSESGHKAAPSVRGLNKNKNKNSKDDNSTGTSIEVDLNTAVGRCSYVEMDLVAWESIEGFDFLKYNQSALFCGLENALPNVYVNSVVQTLYFTPPIRKAVADHSCDRDWCISCELGFLFHMFDLGGAGMACEAGNFTRAFMTMANTGALGLLDGPHSLPLSQRIENFSRYLLEQLHKDDDETMNVTMKRRKKKKTSNSNSNSKVCEIFGATTISYGIFMTSGNKWERLSTPFQHTLSYDNKDDNFCTVLEKCLWQSLDPTRAFCEASQQFEAMTHRRELRELPNALLLGCNSKAKGYGDWWAGPANVTSAGISVEDIAKRCMDRDNRKLVESLKIDVSNIENGISVTEISGGDSVRYGYDDIDSNSQNNSTSELIAEYDLSFVIVHVKAACVGGGRQGQEDLIKYGRRNVGGHLVAYIRVADGYKKQKTNSTGGEWWCFNDFVISKVEQGMKEIGAFDREWKMPCLVGYVRRDLNERVEDTAPWWYSSSSSTDEQVENNQKQSVREVIGYENGNAAIGIQPDEQAPARGSVLGLDCEFVMVSREEAEIFPDGTRQVVIPARKALARVSVIRGYGPLQGQALIDDYVCVREPVVDYLTRFSGLVEGDLHVGRSRFKLSSLKSVYKRLRCLVDEGCIFVGHGLKSDFRIINFVVPADQVIDTVTIFRLPFKRLLGLRFLSHALLGNDIQSEVHDSIEDCNAALALYLLYVGLKSIGNHRFTHMLKELYAYGYRHGWKVEPLDLFVVNWNVDH